MTSLFFWKVEQLANVKVLVGQLQNRGLFVQTNLKEYSKNADDKFIYAKFWLGI